MLSDAIKIKDSDKSTTTSIKKLGFGFTCSIAPFYNSLAPQLMALSFEIARNIFMQ